VIVELTKRAAGDLDRLRRAQPALFGKIIAKIQVLAKQPEAGKPLVGPLKGIRSLRVGDYRILYEVARGTVTVLTVNHRREVYK
jgi:addiction module RelE/StbE family toxin